MTLFKKILKLQEESQGILVKVRNPEEVHNEMRFGELEGHYPLMAKHDANANKMWYQWVEDNRTVGYCILDLVTKTQLEIYEIEKNRIINQPKVGRKMIKEIEKLAKDMGCEQLIVVPDSNDLVSYYEDLGFKHSVFNRWIKDI